ncbi:LysM peptidoglycan-binding domain-containing protein [Streptomyces sp. NPDC001493]
MPDHSPTGVVRPPVRTGRRGAGPAAVLRALVSLVVLIALLAGLPALLWWGTAVVAPAGINALGSLLSTQDSGQVFLLLLAVAGWAGWALFALSVLVEIPAQLRGRAAPRLRLAVGQRMAAALVGAVLVALPAGTALAASASPATAAPASASALSVSTPRASTISTAHGADQEGGHAAHLTHTVVSARPAESLWSIAEQQLGDGNRWEEIASLNAGRVMADGQVFRADGPIQPGWVLRLPDTARTADAASSAPPVAQSAEGGGMAAQGAPGRSPRTYTVEEGDSLSKIATEELDDESRWVTIFELNRDQEQPGGGRFTDPDRIYPGQHLTLPAAAAPSDATPEQAAGDGSGTSNERTSDTAPHKEESPEGASPRSVAPSSAPDASSPRAPRAESPATSGTPSVSAPPSATASQPSVPPQARTFATAAQPDGGTGSTARQAALVGGIGALLAASLAGALGVKRVLQQRRRRAGETITIDADPTLLEQVLNSGGEPATAALLDTALRTLASTAGSDGLPPIRGARISSRTVHLLPDDKNAPAPAPFTSVPGSPGVWVLDPAAVLLDGDTARQVAAPYPGLVTLGATEAGDLILADLMNTVLLLDGDPADVLAIARAMALEAGTSNWTDHTEIITVGLGSRLATLLPKGRVQCMPTVQSVVADLGALLVEVHQDTAPRPLPWFLICAGDVADEQVWQLADAVSAARTLPVAVVLPAGPAARQAFPEADVVTVAPDTPVSVPQLTEGMIRLQRLEEEQYRQFIHALEVADEPARPAVAGWQLSEDHAHAATAPRAVYVGEGGEDPGNPFPALLAFTSAAQEDSGPGGVPGGARTPERVEAAQQREECADLPQIRVLGPLEVSEISGSGHGPKVAALAALIFLRPGRSAEWLCTAMDPASPWSPRTLQSRLSELRARFGNTEAGEPRLPRPQNGYRFRPGAVTSDWDRFQAMATRALSAGAESGIPYLENALGLVRGKPLEGHDYPWADSVQQEIISRVVDVAHTLASWLSEGERPDLDAARHAVLRGLDIDETSEVLFRDWMRIEWAAGNGPGVRKAISRLQQVARTYDISPEPLTEQTMTLVLSEAPGAVFVSKP